mmetsp:Transcript_20670/g.61690  ORF Transcript_20670/g.61690 Transcript_20670/m.61690 type:complete len:345 (+) Transcript_20670:611-1645(+)
MRTRSLWLDSGSKTHHGPRLHQARRPPIRTPSHPRTSPSPRSSLRTRPRLARARRSLARCMQRPKSVVWTPTSCPLASSASSTSTRKTRLCSCWSRPPRASANPPTRQPHSSTTSHRPSRPGCSRVCALRCSDWAPETIPRTKRCRVQSRSACWRSAQSSSARLARRTPPPTRRPSAVPSTSGASRCGGRWRPHSRNCAQRTIPRWQLPRSRGTAARLASAHSARWTPSRTEAARAAQAAGAARLPPGAACEAKALADLTGSWRLRTAMSQLQPLPPLLLLLLLQLPSPPASTAALMLKMTCARRLWPALPATATLAASTAAAAVGLFGRARWRSWRRTPTRRW